MISQIFTHSSDLSVQPLGQYDREAFFSGFSDCTRARHRIKYRHTVTHLPDKCICNHTIYRYLIFFLMIISGTHDPVDKIPLIGKQKKPLGIFVQPSNRIHPYRVIQIFCHRCLLTLFLRTAYNAPWFIKQKNDLFRLCHDRFPIHADDRITRNPLAG